MYSIFWLAKIVLFSITSKQLYKKTTRRKTKKWGMLFVFNVFLSKSSDNLNENH